MRCWTSIATVLITLAGPAQAGVNFGGGMVVHTNDLYSYTSDTQCSTPYVQDLSSCNDVITRTDLQESVVWLLAVFPSPLSEPRVKALTCEISYSPDVWVEGYWLCAPAGSFEIPDATWPDSHSHVSIAFSETIVGQTIFPFYGFRVQDAVETGQFCTELGWETAFSDDSVPSVSDPASVYGCVRWHAQGFTNCFLGAPGACCITDLCFLLSNWECDNQGGTFHEDATCAPSPCLSAVPDQANAREMVALSLTAPNPSRGSIGYAIDLQKPAAVRVQLFDAGGRWLDDVLVRDLPAGLHSYSWQVRNEDRLRSGVYTLRLEARFRPGTTTAGHAGALEDDMQPISLTQRVVVVR